MLYSNSSFSDRPNKRVFIDAAEFMAGSRLSELRAKDDKKITDVDQRRMDSDTKIQINKQTNKQR